MSKGKYPRSVAKHIRQEKAKIRRRVDDLEEQEKLIKELLSQFEGNIRT